MTTAISHFSKWCLTIFTNLWLSVSSVEFYQRIITSYNGYGIKYILNISLISSILCNIFILNYLDNIKQYFSYGNVSPAVANLDKVLLEFPELKYDGSQIFSEQKDPIYIYDTDNRLILAIDLENKMLQSDKSKTPILLTNRRAIFFPPYLKEAKVNNFTINYQQFLGNESQIINQKNLSFILEKFSNQAPKIFTYIIFPLFALIIFFNTLIEKSFLIIAIYLFTYLMSMNFSIKICSRLTMFASGVFVLLYPTIFLIAPEEAHLVWIIQIWTNLLMIIAILKHSKFC